MKVDMRHGRVPDEFPGCVLVDEKPDGNRNHLKKECRTFNGSIAPEFRCFMSRIMPAIAPYRSNYNKFKGIKKLSEMFTVSDEAFGLLMLLNEFDSWKAKAEEEKNGGKAQQTNKKFVDGRSGNKEGWNLAGLNTYKRLCKNLVMRREEESSKELEDEMRRENAIHWDQRNRFLHADDEEEEESDCESMQEKELRASIVCFDV